MSTDSLADAPHKSGKRLLVWCLAWDQHSHIQPVEEWFGDAAEFVYDSECAPEPMLEADPDVALCVNDYTFRIARCITAARRARIPTLVLQDGILEWRCQYENPLFGSGGGAPQHQPVLANKIACIGRQSARHIAAWGNFEKVELTGMPRLDVLRKHSAAPVRKPGNRILVLTAKNPGFNPEQTELTLRSLADLKSVLDRRPDLSITWRIRPELAEILGIDNRLQQFGTAELVDTLDSADAVVSTISTAILEAMLMDRPVAVLDYHNVPRFMDSAWSITAPDHIDRVLGEVLSPSGKKMHFQRQCLNDSLEHPGSASGRVGLLLDAMARVGQECRRSGDPLALPARMLEAHEPFPHTGAPDLADLYPEQPAFRQKDLAELQSMVARLERTNSQLENELNRRSVRNAIFLAGSRLAHRFASR